MYKYLVYRIIFYYQCHFTVYHWPPHIVCHHIYHQVASLWCNHWPHHHMFPTDGEITGLPKLYRHFSSLWWIHWPYNKEQTQKYKFEIWVLKLLFLPPKKAFLVFEEKTKKIVYSCFGFWLCVSALKTINTQMLFCSVFFFMHFKIYWPK